MEHINQFNIEQVKNFWDNVADIYEKENNKVRETHHQRFVESLKYLRIGDFDKILNVWSRTGEAIPYLRQANKTAEIYNLEVSPKMLAIARKNFPEDNFAQTDLENIPFPDLFFDKIISLETLEHCPQPAKFMSELSRILKNDGLLIISTPPANIEPLYAFYNWLGLGHGEGPHKFLSPARVKKIINQTDLKLQIHKGTLLLPVGPKFLKNLGEKIINRFQKTFISNFGIRQFFICQKQLHAKN